MQGWFGGLFIEPDGAWLSAFSCSRQTRQDVKRTCRASLGFCSPVLKTYPTEESAKAQTVPQQPPPGPLCGIVPGE